MFPIIMSVAAGLFILAAALWFAWPFMDRANQRLEKKLRAEGDGVYRRAMDDYSYESDVRWRHICNTIVDTVLTAGLAWVLAAFFHLQVLKTIGLASASVVAFHLFILPFVVFFLARRKQVQGWWRAPLFIFFGTNPVKWYTTITRDYSCGFLDRCRYSHLLTIVQMIMIWRNGDDDGHEEWGGGN